MRCCVMLRHCMLLGLFAATVGNPCPNNAFFTYSLSHDADFCVCSHGLNCFGDDCSQGSPKHLPSFQPAHEGYVAVQPCCRWVLLTTAGKPSCLLPAHPQASILGFQQHAAIVAVGQVLSMAYTCRPPLPQLACPMPTIPISCYSSIATSTSASHRRIREPCTSFPGSIFPKQRHLSPRCCTTMRVETRPRRVGSRKSPVSRPTPPTCASPRPAS